MLAALDAWKVAMLKQGSGGAGEDLPPGRHLRALQRGRARTRQQAITGVVDSQGWEAIEFSETTVRLLPGNVALVNGKTDMHQRNKDKPTTISKLIRPDRLGQGQARAGR